MSQSPELQAFIARIEALRVMNETVAKAAVLGVLAEARATASAGTTPDGKAWPPLRDGGRALEGAAAAIKVEAKGAAIVLRLPTPYAFHQHGGSNGKFHSPKRAIILDKGDPVPPKMLEAISKAAATVFGKVGK